MDSGSFPAVPLTPELRIGRKERDITLNVLAEVYVDERIQTCEEYDKRVGEALEATTQTQLDTITADLLPVPVVKKISLKKNDLPPVKTVGK